MAYPWLEKYLGKRGNKEGLPTKAALARHLGVPDNYVTKLFNGTRQIQIDEIIPIARFFNISADEVLTGQIPPSSSEVKKIPIILETGHLQKKKVVLSIELI